METSLTTWPLDWSVGRDLLAERLTLQVGFLGYLGILGLVGFLGLVKFHALTGATPSLHAAFYYLHKYIRNLSRPGSI